MFAKARGCTII